MRAAAVSSVRNPVMPRSRGVRFAATAAPGSLEKAFAVGCFALLLAFNVGIPSLRIASFPVRGLLASALLLFLAALYTEAASRAVRRHLWLIFLTGAMAALGTFVSLANGAGPAIILKTVTEVHLQIIVNLLIAALLAEICGARAAVAALVGIIAFSGFVAILQVLDIGAAWSAREMLARIQGQSLDRFQPFLAGRPMGLSFSPIHLATQLCLAFAAYTALRDRERTRWTGSAKPDPGVLVALLALILMCAASGTRSPILGAVIFFGVYMAFRRGAWLAIVVMSSAALLYFVWPMIISAIETAQPRVVRVDDGSAVGRSTLSYYGWLLFRDNPLGYGFAFEPFKYWTAYWHELYTLPAPGAVQTKELHNYALSMINTYGVGLLLMLPLVIKLLGKAGASLIFFIPYILHIMFHNSGPFWNDGIIWFVVGALSASSASNPIPALTPRLAPDWGGADGPHPGQVVDVTPNQGGPAGATPQPAR